MIDSLAPNVEAVIALPLNGMEPWLRNTTLGNELKQFWDKTSGHG
jgi:hypothetical protein